jgi:hypothetical protein
MATYFVVDVNGKRTARRDCDEYGNRGRAGAEAMCGPGETVEGPRECPYPGCPNGPTARPPCGLCYE